MPDFSYEEKLGICAGIDEAGRGPLAGVVIAAAVILPADLVEQGKLEGLNDSKKLTAKARQKFYEILCSQADCGIGEASVEEIETLNILQATLLAMKRAVEKLTQVPEHLLIDGNTDPKIGLPTTCIVKGDGISLSIAAASVIAKQTRDDMMLKLATDYPQYDWHKNKGYGTKSHREAIAIHGLSPHHRKLFCRRF